MVLVINKLNHKDISFHLNRHYMSSKTGIINKQQSPFFSLHDRRHNLFPILFFQIMPTKRIVKPNPSPNGPVFFISYDDPAHNTLRTSLHVLFSHDPEASYDDDEAAVEAAYDHAWLRHTMSCSSKNKR